MSTPLTPGLSIIHANKMAPLRELLVAWVKQNPLNPLEQEMFLVQSNGMAQWLKLAFAEDEGKRPNSGIGIAAAQQMQLPSRFMWNAYRTVLGEQAVPKDSPFDKPKLRWRLLKLLPTLLAQPRFVSLKRFLQDDDDLRKRDQLAETLADLLDQYQVYRAEWLDRWARGKDDIINGKGELVPLGEDQLWQSELWRAIIADMPPQWQGTSRAKLHQDFLVHLEQAESRPAGLPRRILVFGISALPQQAVEALKALAKHCQILLCVQNPCQHFWADIVEDRELLRRELARSRHQRKPGAPEVLSLEAMHQHANPLLASWGKQGRDYIGMLYGIDEPDQYRDYFTSIDIWDSPLPERGEPSLLQQIQQGIFDLEPVANTPKTVAADESVVFHLAHSRQREVEVLFDQLLARFEANPELTPSDVLVMMPDVDLYAPHIEAVFGQLDRQDPRHIPFTIADRPERGHQVLVLALEKLMHLPQWRFGVSELLELLAVPALRAKFGIDDTQLELLAVWVEQAGIRWGLDANQRESLALPGELDQNTWRFGLKRMLLGYAVGQGEAWQGIEPLDEVGGLDAALVGKLCLLIDELDHFWHQLSASHPPTQWLALLRQLVENLFLPQDENDTMLLQRLGDEMAKWQQDCEQAGVDEPLPITVVREVALAPFGEEGVSQRFLAGKVNFCTLMPMRAIPFEQVCLLGMNDGDYPRSRPPLDFDLMSLSGQYRPGDRSRREDDRYLFLEALLAAQQQLYISYVGRNVRDNSERTPSVLVGQLRDYIESGFSIESTKDGASSLLDAITTVHPLQPFSHRYFDGSDSKLFSYSGEWCQVHGPTAPMEMDNDTSLPQWQPQSPLGLAELNDLLRDPVRCFMTQRLGVWFGHEIEASVDVEPFGLSALERFGLQHELFETLNTANSTDVDNLLSAQRHKQIGRGQLPMKGFAELSSEELSATVKSLFENQQSLLGELTPVAGSLELKFSSGEVQFEDWLGQLYQDKAGNWVQFQARPGKVAEGSGLKNPLHGAKLYLSHLAASAMGHQFTSFLIASDGVWQLLPMSPSEAQARLTALLLIYQQGMAAPLSVAPRAAFAYLKQAAEDSADEKSEGGSDVDEAAFSKAKAAYEPSFFGGGDLGYSPYLARQFPQFELMEPSRFVALAQALYLPLLTQFESVEA
ncbi:exodeoxyribonuclease V subunit gamma [Ferrimonas aestuarii]|uniref:RecBCD enzyme subunit RecC n=1 Tax=Ferrimonas aestuarii TaxID=2569539 RepID=A0A4U1BSJ2_9GAMM|nr:exodeoxyribonuclease V subunit gamma [Ferrimonas aestuarii]TKB57586.1 exodeoxyribonuclease V subunit gamma [Ferrimonas aestuarii]